MGVGFEIMGRVKEEREREGGRKEGRKTRKKERESEERERRNTILALGFYTNWFF